MTLLISENILGQPIKERRVYYLDCSFSMELLGIWAKVRNNLECAIDNVNDETTELIVIPFAFDCSKNPQLNPIVSYATQEGKNMLKKRIDNLPMNKSTMTYHYVPMEDFYKNRIASDRVTYMFLMTDGQDEDKMNRFKNELLPQWGAKFKDKNVFGFYVMLDKAAKDIRVEKIIDSQPHLWKVETADVDINLIRLQNNAIFNVRNDKYIDLPIFGDTKGITLNASFQPSSPYRVTKVSQKGNNLRIYIDVPRNVASLPVSDSNILSLSVKGCGKFDFLVTDEVLVKCENKKERSLKISVRP